VYPRMESTPSRDHKMHTTMSKFAGSGISAFLQSIVGREIWAAFSETVRAEIFKDSAQGWAVDRTSFGIGPLVSRRRWKRVPLSRQGSGHVRHILAQVDQSWESSKVMGGLASGEGVTAELRDNEASCMRIAAKLAF
jgi:hypothetical protein